MTPKSAKEPDAASFDIEKSEAIGARARAGLLQTGGVIGGGGGDGLRVERCTGAGAESSATRAFKSELIFIFRCVLGFEVLGK